MSAADYWKSKTHCPYGHPYDTANTYYTARGSRICRACGRERKRQESEAQTGRPVVPRGQKTHCAQGHLYDEANTRRTANGRACRACGREHARKKAQAAGRPGVYIEKTHCPQGHPYDEVNTRFNKIGRACRACDLARQTARNDANPQQMLWANAKKRARRYGVPFTITPEDIVIPEVCPVFGTPLARKRRGGPGPDSPTVDRVVPALGYIPSNIAVISCKANALKNRGTLEWFERSLKEGLGSRRRITEEELRLLVEWLRLRTGSTGKKRRSSAR